MAADEEWYTFTGGRIPLGVTRVRIDESLTVIPARAFQWNRNIKEVECHVDVKTVKECAFCTCNSLRIVRMPGVEVVEKKAFSCCFALTDVECGKLETIEERAFGGCISLTSINLPSAKIVESFAFYNTALTNIKFGKELESIGVGAFCNCTSLERITIPLKDGIIAADDTFQGCENLKHVDLVEEAVLRNTIAALLSDEWKIDMNRDLLSIDQILPNTLAGGGIGIDAGGKALAIRMWIRAVLRTIVQYKAQHRSLLNEAANALQHALPNDIVNKSVLPFLKLPSKRFKERITKKKRSMLLLE